MTTKLKKKLLVLEINEIPWRIIDKFKGDKRFPHLTAFFEKAITFTTKIYTKLPNLNDPKVVHGRSKDNKSFLIDSKELSPWVTWPTFHRGMTCQEHGIMFLGQDISTFYGKPIWEEFLDRGFNIGICGSMQSWPPLNPGKGGFYIPDTFAHDKRCIPEYLEPFQKFNLDQVQKNGLVIRQKELFSPKLFELLLSLPRIGIKTSTWVKVVNQLGSEVINKRFVARRVAFQCILFWDIFKSLYKANSPPAFSTFFTNHFASLMHRYWCDIFPEDFDDDFMKNRALHYDTVAFGLRVVDNLLRDAMDFCKINPEIILVFATSMGQDAIKYTAFEGYSAEIEDIDKLLKYFGISKNDYKPLLAMVPQFSFEVPDSGLRKSIINNFNRCFTASGNKIFSVDEAGSTLSVTIHTPSLDDIKAGNIVYKQNGKVKASIPWHEAGIIMHKLDAASAYHIPEGIMAIYGNGIKPDNSRSKIMLQDCKQYLLDLAC